MNHSSQYYMTHINGGKIDLFLTFLRLTFKNLVSYILDGRTATLQMLHFIYFFNKYKYRVF